MRFGDFILQAHFILPDTIYDCFRDWLSCRTIVHVSGLRATTFDDDSVEFKQLLNEFGTILDIKQYVHVCFTFLRFINPTFFCFAVNSPTVRCNRNTISRSDVCNT